MSMSMLLMSGSQLNGWSLADHAPWVAGAATGPASDLRPLQWMGHAPRRG